MKCGLIYAQSLLSLLILYLLFHPPQSPKCVAMNTIRKDTSLKDSVILLQDFLAAAGYEIAVDGDFGPKTDRIVKQFQEENGLVVDGVVGPKTWQVLIIKAGDEVVSRNNRFLSEADLIQAAEKFELKLPIIKAVNEVESGGMGFVGSKPKILFEGHVFWKQLEQAGIKPNDHLKGNETVLYKKWTSQFYLGGLKEHRRLEQAKLINEAAALESASWGLFQIMGNNWKSLGYSSIKEFVTLMDQDEGAHLEAFGRFLKVNKLIEPLQKLQWAKFARRYNGAGFKKNKYDEKLERAYQKFK